MLSLIGQKKTQSQRFLANGKRIPVTLIDVKDNTVISVKTQENNNYQAVQLGFSMKKKATKAELGHAKGAKLEKAPKFLREVRILDESETLPEVGVVLNPSEVFSPGDIVDVLGVSKGKGFQGGVKRHGFHGGPKTHGQSDRHRAPGSIGQGTTPGRVYKGKKMAGRMGNENVTVGNLEVVQVTNDGVLVIKGLVPGIINGLVVIKKVGTDAKFVPLQKTQEEIEAEEKARLEEESVRQAQDKAAAEEAEKTAKDSGVDGLPEEAKAEEAQAEATSEESENEESVEEPKEEIAEEKVDETDSAETEATKTEEVEEVEEVKEDAK